MQETGVILWLPLAPQLLDAIVAMNPQDTRPFCRLITKFKRPFTKESFGSFFKNACVAAGLPHCSAHGHLSSHGRTGNGDKVDEVDQRAIERQDTRDLYREGEQETLGGERNEQTLGMRNAGLR